MVKRWYWRELRATWEKVIVFLTIPKSLSFSVVKASWPILSCDSGSLSHTSCRKKPNLQSFCKQVRAEVFYATWSVVYPANPVVLLAKTTTVTRSAQIEKTNWPMKEGQIEHRKSYSINSFCSQFYNSAFTRMQRLFRLCGCLFFCGFAVSKGDSRLFWKVALSLYKQSQFAFNF